MIESAMDAHGLKFVLVPDASAARRVRRLIAERGACSGVVVGSWTELVDWARSAYLVAVRKRSFRSDGVDGKSGEIGGIPPSPQPSPSRERGSELLSSASREGEFLDED